MRSLLGFVCLSVPLLACGGSGSGSSGGGGDAGLPPGAECTNNDNCPPGEVCSAVGTCELPGESCTDQSQCTGGTYCDPGAEVCLPSGTGTPCAGPENCNGECVSGFCGCDGLAFDRQLEGGALDVYLVLDRTGSMGRDCDY